MSMHALGGKSKKLGNVWLVALGLFALVGIAGAVAQQSAVQAVKAALGLEPVTIGETPVITEHLAQADIDSGNIGLDKLLEHGARLFLARFNSLDGAGRPESTGTGAPRPRREFPDNFNRSSAPDSNSCAGCHNQPRTGGAGDNVANVFVLAQANAFITSIAPEDTLERNTLGMFGGGPIEMLAREMSTDLINTRQMAIDAAVASGEAVTMALTTKGVNFGHISAFADGSVDTSGVEGVDTDLIIKPFHQKGAVISLRQFTNNAMNHHHGMQSAERFGDGADPDADGHANELTRGDMTAITIWQAALGTPGRVIPRDGNIARAIGEGFQTFQNIGCATCHVSALKLNNPIFSEPNAFNPSGNLRPEDVSQLFTFDMTSEGFGPRLERTSEGGAIVRAFTDLKRHAMGPVLEQNELLVQAGVPTDQFITRKLWDAGNSAPYLARGRAFTLTEAILAHGGEAQAARDNFGALTPAEQAEVVAFLKSLQVLPEGARSLIVDQHGRPHPRH